MGEKHSIDVTVDIEDIVCQLDVSDIVEHYKEEDLLMQMGYDISTCFKTFYDLRESIEEDPSSYGLELKEYFDGMNDNDIYDRFLNLLCNNKLTYSEWDEILSKYE